MLTSRSTVHGASLTVGRYRLIVMGPLDSSTSSIGTCPNKIWQRRTKISRD